MAELFGTSCLPHQQELLLDRKGTHRGLDTLAGKRSPLSLHPQPRSSDPTVTCEARILPLVQSPKTSLGTFKIKKNCPYQVAKPSLPGVGLYLSHKGEEFRVWIQFLGQDGLKDIESALPRACFVVTLSLIRILISHSSTTLHPYLQGL